MGLLISLHYRRFTADFVMLRLCYLVLGNINWLYTTGSSIWETDLGDEFRSSFKGHRLRMRTLWNWRPGSKTISL